MTTAYLMASTPPLEAVSAQHTTALLTVTVREKRMHPFNIQAICGVAAPILATKDAVLMMLPPPARRSAGIPYLQPNHTPE